MSEKKKCGIITFHRAINYGAVLQAFALRNYINKNFSVDCDVIDYRCESIENMYKPSNSKNPKYIIKNFFGLKKQNKFMEFVNEKIGIKNPIKKSELASEGEKYDVLITGSDQVWGESRVGKDNSYFLDFVKESDKKVSYAASMGSESISEDKRELYRNLLSDFRMISTREESAAESLSELLGREVSVSLDPTLLLLKDEWRNIASDRFKNKNYLLIYTLTSSEKLIRFAKKTAKEKGLEIYYISDTFHHIKGVKILRCLSPEDWVAAFLNASYVVTNSFHGTAFSVNFNKDFNVEITAGLAQRGTRITDFLNLLGLQERLIGENTVCDKIDFTKINEILDIETEKSYKYLSEAIKSGGKE